MNYANLYGYTDITPFEIIKRTTKTISIREMYAEKNEDYKPEFIQGGYCATCTNQQDQKWNIISDPTRPVIKAYLRKDGNYYSRYGKHFLSDKPIRFYDFNF